jgi:hypothetical protein
MLKCTDEPVVTNAFRRFGRRELPNAAMLWAEDAEKLEALNL